MLPSVVIIGLYNEKKNEGIEETPQLVEASFDARYCPCACILTVNKMFQR